MHFKSLPIEIPDDDPFSNDKLDRKEYVETLSNFVSKLNGPFVLAINSPWGTGKSTLIDMWRKYLHQNNHVTIYFNAWETDFSSSPLVSFIGEVTRSLKELPGKKTDITKILDKTKSLTTSIVRHSVPAAIKAVTFGAVDTKEIYEEIASEAAENISKDLVDAYLENRSKINEFHETLEKAFDWATSKEKKSPILIFVDELDRCRPSYAIELLENIKHLFNTKNAIFILAIDKSQLNVSLASVYGAGIDATEYLRRFIDLEFVLPNPNNKQFLTESIKKFGLSEYFSNKVNQLKGEEGELVSILHKLFEIFELTPRAREHCISRIAVAASNTPENYYFYPDLAAILTVLRTANSKSSKMFHDYINHKLPTSEIISYIRALPKGNKFMESNHGMWLEGVLIGARAGRNEDSDELESYRIIVNAQDSTEEHKARARRVLEFAKRDFHGSKYASLKVMMARLELIQLKEERPDW